ncbi:MAG TPA: glycine cleavage system protein H, partial [Candidatus Hydrogenedentes bacterium]|nr:glycine cleavage system protein H [Candidatus Hydrogenedentota bacterium]
LPDVGMKVRQGVEVATVESVKAASDIYAPAGGRVCEVNEMLEDQPELVNQDPYGEGWFFKLEGVKTAELDELMDAAAYRRYVAENT